MGSAVLLKCIHNAIGPVVPIGHIHRYMGSVVPLKCIHDAILGRTFSYICDIYEGY